MTTDKQNLTEETVKQLAEVVVSKESAFVADYNKANDMGHIKNEDYAPVADLCSEVYHNYLTEQGLTAEQFQNGQAGRILRAVREIKGV